MHLRATKEELADTRAINLSHNVYIIHITSIYLEDLCKIYCDAYTFVLWIQSLSRHHDVSRGDFVVHQRCFWRHDATPGTNRVLTKKEYIEDLAE